MELTEEQLNYLKAIDSKAFKLKTKISKIADGSRLIDIETAFILIMGEIFIHNFDEKTALVEASKIHSRLVAFLVMRYDDEKHKRPEILQ